MKKFRVFPDYCSTGLWNSEDDLEAPFANTEPEKYLSVAECLSLKYWHWTWEFLIANDCMEENGKPHLSETGIKIWFDDGKKLVDFLNEKYQGKYLFEYEVNLE